MRRIEKLVQMWADQIIEVAATARAAGLIIKEGVREIKTTSEAKEESYDQYHGHSLSGRQTRYSRSTIGSRTMKTTFIRGK
jgi:hypothetical protein